MAISISAAFPTFNDKSGMPLDNGYIYIGAEGLNPQVHPILVYWDAELTIPASQPIRTVGGYYSRSGSPGQIYSSVDYSITVLDKDSTLIYTALSPTQRVGGSEFPDIFSTSDVNLGVSLVGQSIQNINSKSDLKAVTLSSTRRIWADGSFWEPVTGASPGTYSDNSTVGYGTIVIPSGGDGSQCWRRNIIDRNMYATFFGAIGDDSTDNQTAIDEALAAARIVKARVIFPARLDGQAIYRHSGTIYYNASDLEIMGEGTSVQLRYTGTGTAIQVNTTPASDPSRERVKLKNISLVSSTGAIGINWTGANYGEFHGYEMAYTATNAKLHYATGNGGTGSYYNSFDSLSLFGGDRTQMAFEFARDLSGNLSDGPNANVFSNIKRIASVSRAFNIISGTGNLFTNISAESVSDCMFVFNDLPSLADSGTATATTTNTLTDTSKTWSTTIGDPLNFVNGAVIIKSGAYAGESRRILTNTVDTITVDKPWPTDIGTPSYWIYLGKAVKNMVANIRQEGLASDNPDCIRFITGARGNEVRGLDAGSLGSGVVLDDQSGDPSNKVYQGELIIATFALENPGPSTTLQLVPRNSSFGGIQNGSNQVIEFVEIVSPNFVAGSASATVTVDQGGTLAGNGTVSIACEINDYNTERAFIANKAKSLLSSSNYPIFIQFSTNANVNAASDFIVNVAYRSE